MTVQLKTVVVAVHVFLLYVAWSGTASDTKPRALCRETFYSTCRTEDVLYMHSIVMASQPAANHESVCLEPSALLTESLGNQGATGLSINHWAADNLKLHWRIILHKSSLFISYFSLHRSLSHALFTYFSGVYLPLC